TLAVALEVIDPTLSPPAPPKRIIVDFGHQQIALNDEGRDGDEKPGDGLYSAAWTPSEIRRESLEFRVDEGATAPATAVIYVRGRLHLRDPPSIVLGKIESGSESSGRLDLSASEVVGRYPIEIFS